MPIDQKDLDGEDPTLKIKKAVPLETLIGKLKEELRAMGEKGVEWNIRQKARQDAHKLRGDYPSEKIEHEAGGNLCELVVKTLAEARKNEKENDAT